MTPKDFSFKIGDKVEIKNTGEIDIVKYLFISDGQKMYVLTKDYNEKEEKWIGYHGFPYHEHELIFKGKSKITNWKEELK